MESCEYEYEYRLFASASKWTWMKFQTAFFTCAISNNTLHPRACRHEEKPNNRSAQYLDLKPSIQSIISGTIPQPPCHKPAILHTYAKHPKRGLAPPPSYPNRAALCRIILTVCFLHVLTV
jgi:hypothetical protein